MTHQPEYVTLAELAARWRKHPATARQYTRTRGFPQPLTLSARALLWPLAEVVEWEATCRATVRLSRLPHPPVPIVAPVVRPLVTRGAR